jgi:hypothetical protein
MYMYVVLHSHSLVLEVFRLIKKIKYRYPRISIVQVLISNERIGTEESWKVSPLFPVLCTSKYSSEREKWRFVLQQIAHLLSGGSFRRVRQRGNLRVFQLMLASVGAVTIQEVVTRTTLRNMRGGSPKEQLRCPTGSRTLTFLMTKRLPPLCNLLSRIERRRGSQKY